MRFLNFAFVPIPTCCEGGGDGLAPPLVPEGHQVDGVLLPWSQTSLHKGSDGAGQLRGHPSIIVLPAVRHKAMHEKTMQPRPRYCIFSTSHCCWALTCTRWLHQLEKESSPCEHNHLGCACDCFSQFRTLHIENGVILEKYWTVLLWHVCGYILQEHTVTFKRPVTHPHGASATPCCFCRATIAHVLLGNRWTSKPAPRS